MPAMKWLGNRWLMSATLVVLALATFVTLNNASWLAPVRGGTPTILAHRGMAQTYPRAGLTAETCTAERIFPPEHPYLEGTIASMRAAFDLGADVVEFDIHPTTDGQFAVFHDWTLDCRTNGSGVTREKTLPELQALDIGYGYTADGGRTFPFRGKGVGLMPSLDQVLAAFPGHRLLINIKSNDPQEGVLLAERLAKLPSEHLARLMAYGGNRPIEAIHARLPSLRVMSRATLTDCLMNYELQGWAGFVPSACKETLILLPVDVAPWLWGWPNRFLERFDDADTQVFVVGPYEGDFASGIDDAEVFLRLPKGFTGGVWTNRVDRIAPLMRPVKPKS